MLAPDRSTIIHTGENMKTRFVVLGGMLLAACSLQAAAGNAADASIGKKLDAQQLKYDVDGDGDYKLLFEAKDGRSQIVWVRSQVETLGGMRIREVLSIGGKLSKVKGTEDIAAQAVLTSGAMLKSSSQKLGGWVLKPDGEDSVFYYVAQVPADLNSDDHDTVARMVAKSADEFEVLIEAMTDKDKKDTF